MFHSSMYTAPYNIKKTRYETERIRRLVHNVLKNIRVNEFLVYSFFYIVYQNVEDVAVGLNIPPPVVVCLITVTLFAISKFIPLCSEAYVICLLKQSDIALSLEMTYFVTSETLFIYHNIQEQLIFQEISPIKECKRCYSIHCIKEKICEFFYCGALRCKFP